MPDQTTIEAVRAVIYDNFGIEEAPPTDEQELSYDARLTNNEAHIRAGGYGLDSLDMVELAMSIEDKFAIEIPDGDTQRDKFNTVAQIAAYVDGRLAK